MNFYPINNNLSLDLSTGKITIHPGALPNWKIHLVDTGLNTLTGGRIKRLKEWIGNETFMLTYGDGVADVNIHDLLAFHKKNKKLATVTAVRPPARFGALKIESSHVTEFLEKQQSGEGWINGGFFVLEPEVLNYIEGDHTSWEKEPLEALAAQNQLVSYLHNGFWQPMDTLREHKQLENLWENSQAPWKVWK